MAEYAIVDSLYGPRPAAKKSARPAAKKSARPAAKTQTRPAAKKSVRPAAKKSVTRPAAKTQTRPAAKKSIFRPNRTVISRPAGQRPIPTSQAEIAEAVREESQAVFDTTIEPGMFPSMPPMRLPGRPVSDVQTTEPMEMEKPEKPNWILPAAIGAAILFFMGKKK